MKKLFITLTIIVCMVSCVTPDGDTREKKDGYYIITIDGCEYIEVKYCAGCNNGYYSLTHKGNCKNPIHKCN